MAGGFGESGSSLARTQEEGAAVAASTTRTQPAANLPGEAPCPFRRRPLATSSSARPDSATRIVLVRSSGVASAPGHRQDGTWDGRHTSGRMKQAGGRSPGGRISTDLAVCRARSAHGGDRRDKPEPMLTNMATRGLSVRAVPTALLIAIVVWVGAQVASVGLGGSDQGVTMGNQLLRENYLVLLSWLVPIAVVAVVTTLRSGRLSSVALWMCLAFVALVLLVQRDSLPL